MKQERLRNRFIGARPMAIRRKTRGGKIAAVGVMLAAAIMAPAKLLAVQWIVNSQSAGRAETNVVVTAKLQMVTNRFMAYAQIEPIAALPIRAVEAGQVARLEIVPGTMVHAGQKLAELTGPVIQSALKRAEAAVRSTRTSLLSLRKSLAIERRQLASHLVTRQTLLQAKDAVAQAQSAFDTAQARLRALRQTITVKAPADGTVLVVNASEGEQVSVGETILTLQSADKLWLKAEYYGADTAAIHPGMTGKFSPAAGGKPIPVKVVKVFGALNPDGGESVGLLADTPPPGSSRQSEASAGWLNGQFGAVVLKGPVRQMVAVPTRALILEDGRWWVLVHTGHGDRRQEVTPGPTRGWQTFIGSGLKPGEQVVAENAYLEFHQNIANTYTPPD